LLLHHITLLHPSWCARTRTSHVTSKTHNSSGAAPAAAAAAQRPAPSPSPSPQTPDPSPQRAESREQRAESRDYWLLATGIREQSAAYSLQLTAYSLQLTAYSLQSAERRQPRPFCSRTQSPAPRSELGWLRSRALIKDQQETQDTLRLAPSSGIFG
jgi:hypothetical protein